MIMSQIRTKCHHYGTVATVVYSYQIAFFLQVFLSLGFLGVFLGQVSATVHLV